ncbi:6807_t:CDS:1, partial [Scutellospora calospora]
LFKAYTPTTICNAFKTTGIWPFNSDAISPSRLEPSMAIHNFDLPNSEQPNSEQPIRSLTSLSPSPNLVPNYLSLTSTNEEL